MIARLAAAAVAALLAALPGAVLAQSSIPGIDQRQANQDQRIDQGIGSGALTRPEARRLERGQNRIERMEGRALADSTVTGKERARIHHAQAVESRRIVRQKHDGQTRR